MNKDAEVMVLLTVAQIPEMSKVKKLNGYNIYLLRSHIEIYNDAGGRTKEIKPETPGCKFLINTNGSLATIPSDKKLLWITTIENLIHYIQQSAN